jgi:hypothetical protein
MSGPTTRAFFSICVRPLRVESPPPKGNVADDPFCFDKDIQVYHPSGKVTSGFIDFYKADHFIIEAKQGSDQTGKGKAKRGTPQLSEGDGKGVCAGDRLYPQRAH